MHFMLSLLLVCSFFFLMTGCATLPVSSVSEDQRIAFQKGVYHKVSQGETLWRIAKTYEVALDDIIQVNRIPNAASIELNQLIFIPGAESVKKVIPATVSSSTEQCLIDNDVDFIWPVQGGRVVSFFGDRKGETYNQGIDIKVSDDSSVRASRAGKVVLLNYLVGFGQVIVLEHTDGLYSVYGHNVKVFVKLGDRVPKAHLMAQAKTSKEQGIVYFALRRGYKPQNPLHYLSRE